MAVAHHHALDAGTWTPADVLYIYRARWQVELVLKKMKQLLRLNQMRSTHLASVEATVRALLVAWALHEDTTTRARSQGSNPWQTQAMALGVSRSFRIFLWIWSAISD
jgi:hypothetical protein